MGLAGQEGLSTVASGSGSSCLQEVLGGPRILCWSGGRVLSGGICWVPLGFRHDSQVPQGAPRSMSHATFL